MSAPFLGTLIFGLVDVKRVDYFITLTALVVPSV